MLYQLRFLKLRPAMFILVAGIVVLISMPVTVIAQDASAITSLAYNPSGTMIAVSGSIAGNGTDPSAFAVRILDVTTGQVIKHLLGMTSTSNSVSWSPDGSKLASLSVSALSEVYIWDLSTEQLLLTFPVPTQGTFDVLWSPNGDLLAITNPGNQTLLVDASTGEVVGTVGGISADWDPDGSRVVTGGATDNFVLVEEIVPRTGFPGEFTGNQVLRLTGASSPNLDVDWSSNASRVASGEAQDIAHVWDAASGQLLFSQSIPNLLQVELSPDGEQLAILSLDFLSLNGAIQIWDVLTGNLLYTTPISQQEVNALGWSPDGSELAFSASDGSPDSIISIIPAPGVATPSPTPTFISTSTFTSTPTPTTGKSNPRLTRSELQGS